MRVRIRVCQWADAVSAMPPLASKATQQSPFQRQWTRFDSYTPLDPFFFLPMAARPRTDTQIVKMLIKFIGRSLYAGLPTRLHAHLHTYLPLLDCLFVHCHVPITNQRRGAKAMHSPSPSLSSEFIACTMYGRCPSEIDKALKTYGRVN